MNLMNLTYHRSLHYIQFTNCKKEKPKWIMVYEPAWKGKHQSIICVFRSISGTHYLLVFEIGSLRSLLLIHCSFLSSLIVPLHLLLEETAVVSSPLLLVHRVPLVSLPPHGSFNNKWVNKVNHTRTTLWTNVGSETEVRSVWGTAWAHGAFPSFVRFTHSFHSYTPWTHFLKVEWGRRTNRKKWVERWGWEGKGTNVRMVLSYVRTILHILFLS